MLLACGTGWDLMVAKRRNYNDDKNCKLSLLLRKLLRNGKLLTIFPTQVDNWPLQQIINMISCPMEQHCFYYL